MRQAAELSLFDEILAEPLNRLVEQAIDRGRVPVGYTCSYVPRAFLSVDGLFPVRLRAPGIAGTEIADTYLSSVICSYTRSLLEFAMDGRYDFLGGWVFAVGCDHARRLFDNLLYLRAPSFAHLLDLPHKLGEPALDWFTDELRLLANGLAAHFGADFSEQSLSRAVRAYNENLSLLGSIAALREHDRPLITGGEFLRVMLASLVAPADLLAPHIISFREQVIARGNAGHFRARLLVAGGVVDDPSFIDVIESVGGLVVADRFCTGSIPGLEPLPETGDPLRAIAATTLGKTPCPRMMEEFETRASAILAAVRDSRADGVILQAIKFCDTWGVDGSALASRLRSEGVPVLRLEREYRLGGEGQLRTRVQAFLESMGK